MARCSCWAVLSAGGRVSQYPAHQRQGGQLLRCQLRQSKVKVQVRGAGGGELRPQQRTCPSSSWSQSTHGVPGTDRPGSGGEWWPGASGVSGSCCQRASACCSAWSRARWSALQEEAAAVSRACSASALRRPRVWEGAPGALPCRCPPEIPLPAMRRRRPSSQSRRSPAEGLRQIQIEGGVSAVHPGFAGPEGQFHPQRFPVLPALELQPVQGGGELRP